MSIFDGLKNMFTGGPSFKTGPISKSKKFKMECTTCSSEVDMSIPSGFQEPCIRVTCKCPSKAEVLSVI